MATRISENSFIVSIVDISMSPEFYPGDHVVVDPDQQVGNSDYVAVQNGEAITIRKTVLSEREPPLFLMNRGMEDHAVIDKELTGAAIIGKVVQRHTYY